MFIWKNEELQRAAQRSVAADSDIFRDELGAAEAAGGGGEEMDTSQNSEDESQAERTETGMAMVLTSINRERCEGEGRRAAGKGRIVKG